ncbi:hypothetical protein RHAL1_00373 [Beijerinckiaceae bacterium RH AL1]|nr:DUF1698 domain-containing protein [Beijerinckiaceae bacterium]VVB42767.1 hypothetical protein RHAL8_00353 [Beijerinckiaceae bacterium RH AL8]VVB42777.1 hypothetical protein RHCH11_RHCH11_00355 [Beijerinckiaceae bacterium RH CH11]VVC53492.1 hypothetical protein RHAL1_00373 [Beijerinckiaceae bacterium RH AL1]
MDPRSIFPTYSSSAPSNQATLDILQGHWVSSFPPEMGVVAGNVAHFDQSVDSRVRDVALHFDFKDKSVLELGPLEAYQTKHLCDFGAHPVIAVESNDISYLKCLIVKEMMRIKADIVFGDALEYLKACQRKFDVIWASGILYHQTDPLEFLRLLCKLSDAFFVWTQYWTAESAAKFSNFDPARDKTFSSDGFEAICHYRSYEVSSKPISFSGGNEAFAYWMDGGDILNYVRSQGFLTGQERFAPDAPFGPAMSFFAQRTK